MNMTEFLLARIAEVEVVAAGASPGPWGVNSEGDEVLAVDGITVAEGFALSSPQLRTTVAHIACHDPDRVLAECTAKRAIVALHPIQGMKGQSRADERGCVSCNWDDLSGFVVQGPCATLRALAHPDVDHLDYRDEWTS